MRPLETVLVLLAAITVVWHLDWPQRFRRPLAAAAAVAGALHLGLEGFRWQMTPALALVAALLVAPDPVRRRRLWAAAVAVAVLVPVLIPVPVLAGGDGPFSVGTTTVLVEDRGRVERYGPEPGGPRRLPIHIWYPAEPSVESAPWLDRVTLGTVATEYGLPGFFLDHIALVDTAPLDVVARSGDARYPVVIYSHGWTGFGRISPDQPERLASHGYVVIAPDHTYGALVAAFPEGPVRYDPAALPEQEEVGDEVFDAAATQLVGTYAADLIFVMDWLETVDVVGLDGLLDLDRIGIYGHSTGGGAAVAACGDDPRCDAVFGLDPWVEPVGTEILERGLEQPFHAMRSEEWIGGPNDEVLFPFYDAGAEPRGVSALLGADHNDFVAMSQISPLAAALGFKGPISGLRAQQIIGGSLLAFFDAALGDGGSMPEYPELRLDR